MVLRDQEDEIQEAKSYSNNSSAYTMLGEYENARNCAKSVIALGQKLQDKVLNYYCITAPK
jgi:hypothetical protein